VARIELPADDLRRALECREQMVKEIRALGYKHVTLDLAGFRSESPVPLTIKSS
jgi:pyridinium-3,5-biscarboxylic acid mononucleotide sulfurtransferase